MFRQNADKFLFTVGGVFGIVFGIEKSSHICIKMFQVFGVQIVLFGSSQ